MHMARKLLLSTERLILKPFGPVFSRAPLLDTTPQPAAAPPGTCAPSRSDMRHPATQALFAYWNDVRGARRAPRRLEIQPARIGALLLDTFILERAGQSVFLFRLAGTRVAARFGLDLKARDFLSCWGEGDRALVEHHLQAIADLGRIGLLTGEAELRGGGPDHARSPDSRTFELLMLPLVHTGQAIDRLLCQMVSLGDGDPVAPGTVARLRLLAAEAVWPDGQREDPDALSQRQLPLSPHVRTARIVRHGHRQFRVYNGGLNAARSDPGESL